MHKREEQQPGFEHSELRESVERATVSAKELIRSITPIVRFRVARILARQFGSSRYDIAFHDLEELTQDVLARLFANNARIIRAWDGYRGLSFQNYVGLIAERFASRLVKTRNRQFSLKSLVPICVYDESLEDSVPGPEALFAAREYCAVLVRRIRHELSPRGDRLFELLLLEERPVDEVCHLTGLSPDATYTWRSRLCRLARRIAREVDTEEPGSLNSLSS